MILNPNFDIQMLDFFSSKGEIVEYLILEYMLTTNEPVGSWVLKVRLEHKGMEVSTATVGRSLKNLDAKGYTKLVETRGRKITYEGATYVKELMDKVQRDILQRKIMDAAQPHNLSEVLQLMRARKIIECETAKLAAIHADSNDLKSIENSIIQHEDCVVHDKDLTEIALDFHGRVALASKNRFLNAVIDILIYEEIKLESKIEDLVTRERGEEYLMQHRLIADAIRNRDAQESEKQMGLHMDTMIADVEEQIKKKGGL